MSTAEIVAKIDALIPKMEPPAELYSLSLLTEIVTLTDALLRTYRSDYRTLFVYEGMSIWLRRRPRLYWNSTLLPRKGLVMLSGQVGWLCVLVGVPIRVVDKFMDALAWLKVRFGGLV